MLKRTMLTLDAAMVQQPLMKTVRMVKALQQLSKMLKSPMRQACEIDAVAVDIVAVVVVYAEGGAVAVTLMSFPEHYCVGKILCGTCRRCPTLAADAVFDDVAAAVVVVA